MAFLNVQLTTKIDANHWGVQQTKHLLSDIKECIVCLKE